MGAISKKRRRYRRSRKKRTTQGLLLLLGALLLILAGQYQKEPSKAWDADIGQAMPQNGIQNTANSSVSVAEQENTNTERALDQLTITYLNVGQADCTILQWQEYAMLIDAGDSEGSNVNEEYILESLEGLGIRHFDYVIATHSHEDHIGAMDEILEQIPVDYLIYPEEDAATAAYYRFLEAAEKNTGTILHPVPGETRELGGLRLTILAPAADYGGETNNASVAVRLVYGENSFLFTGDAEEESEEQMLQLGLELEADVYQAGHHGSSTSNTEAFLNEVDPIYAIISCGADNSYGHPHSEVLARLEEMDVQIYRTDTMGTITLTSDGKNIKISTEENAEQ